MTRHAGPAEVWAAVNGVTAVSCLDLISRRGNTLLAQLLCEKDGRAQQSPAWHGRQSHGESFHLLKLFGRKMIMCQHLSNLARHTMAHHRIFHVRECGADPQFVPAVISSGQSGAVINITVLAARAQTGGAIGTGRLGWAGLGWDVEIIEQFLLRNPGAGCPW